MLMGFHGDAPGEAAELPKGCWGRRPARAPYRGECPNPRWSARVRASDPESLTHWRNAAALPNCYPTKSARRLRDSGQVLFFSQKHLDRPIVRSA